MKTLVTLVFSLVLSQASFAQEDGAATALEKSVDELRSSVGLWNTTTEFIADDGSVAKSVEGTYEFSWVVPDRVISGKSSIPEMGQAAGILFYIREAKAEIEMVSVGSDGRLWIMTGALGGNERTTPEFATQAGGTGQLRFTRYNVAEDTFESRMDYSEDGGENWKQGNHQVFRRVPQS